jgi:hypothetical protein
VNPRHAVLAVALAASAALVYLDGGALAGGGAAVDAVVEPAARRAPPPAASLPAAGAGLLAQTPRADLFGAQYDDALFGSRDFTPPPPPAPPAPAAPAGPPPLPYSYLGKMLGDGQWQVFLGRGAEALVAREGMVIDGRYRVERVAPPVLTLTYLPLNQQQQLDIGSD